MYIVRLNFVHPDPTDPQETADRYRAGIDIAEYADANGFSMISTEEHQATPMGWSPTPLVTAGAILARTTNVSVAIAALLVPLHDPVRVAEQIAVLDLLSKGRIIVTTGIGYRPVEYAALGRDWSRRGALLDEAIETMQAVWNGEPIEVDGEQVVIGPRPYTRPHPMLLIGGSSKVAARRAARYGLPFQVPGHHPGLEDYYNDQCEQHGTFPMYIAPERAAMVHIVDDPDRAWAELGEHFWFEAKTYKSWQPPGQHSAVTTSANSVDELRAEGIYKFLTPAEAIDHVRRSGALALHPLCGGMPIDSAWQSVQYAVDEVLPALT